MLSSLFRLLQQWLSTRGVDRSRASSLSLSSQHTVDSRRQACAPSRPFISASSLIDQCALRFLQKTHSVALSADAVVCSAKLCATATSLSLSLVLFVFLFPGFSPPVFSRVRSRHRTTLLMKLDSLADRCLQHWNRRQSTVLYVCTCTRSSGAAPAPIDLVSRPIHLWLRRIIVYVFVHSPGTLLSHLEYYVQYCLKVFV